MTERQKQLLEIFESKSKEEVKSWLEKLDWDDQKWVKRLSEMHEDFWAETNDPESEEWREDLTPAEKEVVAAWDGSFIEGYAKLIRDIARQN